MKLKLKNLEKGKKYWTVFNGAPLYGEFAGKEEVFIPSGGLLVKNILVLTRKLGTIYIPVDAIFYDDGMECAESIIKQAKKEYEATIKKAKKQFEEKTSEAKKTVASIRNKLKYR